MRCSHVPWRPSGIKRGFPFYLKETVAPSTWVLNWESSFVGLQETLFRNFHGPTSSMTEDIQDSTLRWRSYPVCHAVFFYCQIVLFCSIYLEPRIWSDNGHVDEESISFYNKQVKQKLVNRNKFAFWSQACSAPKHSGIGIIIKPIVTLAVSWLLGVSRPSTSKTSDVIKGRRQSIMLQETSWRILTIFVGS